MSDKKTVKKVEETEMMPQIVEVYGDENKLKTQNVKLKTDTKEEADKDEEKVEFGEIEEEKEESEPADVKTMAGEEERMTLETLKTEVVGAKANLKLKTENSKLESNEENKQMQDDRAFEEEIGSQKKVTRSVFGVGAIILLIIFGLTGWAFYLKTIWSSKDGVTSVLVSKPEEVVEPTPSPMPALAPLTREEITLQILNGSGVVGLAGKTAKVFEDLGYKAPDTGNGQTVKKTELFIKKDLESRLTVLLADVQKTLSVASISGYLKDTDTMTAKIVLAKQ